MIGATILRLATSRVGIVLIMIGAVFAWHKLDKGSAVRDAVVHYVADVELRAAEAERDALTARLAATQEANDAMRASQEQDNREAADADIAIEEYARNSPVPDACVVDDRFLDLMLDF